MKKTIIVNDIAATTGGALEILKQFLDEVINNKKARSFNWIVFSGTTKFQSYQKDYLRIIHIDKMPWLKRLWWESKGLHIWCQRTKINPAALVSLMNVGFRNGDIPQIVYVHQPLPFGDFQDFRWYEWKPRIKRWLLPIEMKWTFNQLTSFVVQTNWMKTAVENKFKIRKNKIFIFRPRVKMDHLDSTSRNNAKWNYLLFYPSVPGTSYKNHELLIRSLYILKSKNTGLYNKIKMVFTCKPEDRRLTRDYAKLADNLGVSEKIEWTGYLSKKEIVNEYYKADLILFPSKLETFGLPLIEAASIGKPIIALDKPYANDVLNGYQGVKFLKDNPEKWSEEITNFYEKNKKSFKSLDYNDKESWSAFIDLVISKTKQNDA